MPPRPQSSKRKWDQPLGRSQEAGASMALLLKGVNLARLDHMRATLYISPDHGDWVEGNNPEPPPQTIITLAPAMARARRPHTL